jgi:hypothetical protein
MSIISTALLRRTKSLLTLPIMYEDAWRRLQRGRSLMIYATLGLVMWLLLEGLLLDPYWEITTQFLITSSICIIFWSYASVRYLYSLCPRCGYSFQAGIIGYPWTFWPRKKCIHCGLAFGVDPENLPKPIHSSD